MTKDRRTSIFSLKIEDVSNYRTCLAIFLTYLPNLSFQLKLLETSIALALTRNSAAGRMHCSDLTQRRKSGSKY